MPAPFSEGRVKRLFTLGKLASDRACVSGSINAAYSDAIEICGGVSGVKGLGVLTGLIGLAGAVMMLAPLYWAIAFSRVSGTDIFLSTGLVLASVAFAVLAIVFFRLDVFSFRDEPILFNRAARKVHVFRRRTNWRRPISPWPVTIDTYDWDCIHAEVKGGAVYNGALVVFRYWMYLAVTDRPGSKTVIDRFVVGPYETAAGDHAPRWEHIRRYMEEGGPPVYADDEFTPFQRFSHRAALGIGFFILSPEFPRWFRNAPILTTLAALVCVIGFPFFLVIGVCVWLARATARAPYWTPEILKAAGGAPLPHSVVRAKALESPRALERKAEVAQIEAERAEIGAKPPLTVAAPTRRAIWVTLAIVGAMVAAKLGLEWWRG